MVDANICVKFASEKSKERFFNLHPLVIMVVSEISNFCKSENHTITLTETVTTKEEDQSVDRKSSTHRTSRAVDIRVNDMPEGLAQKITNHFNFKFRHIAAVNPSGVSELIVFKPHGTGPHLHVQIHSRFALPEFKN